MRAREFAVVDDEHAPRREQSASATTSSVGCNARERRVVFDLAPLEHFMRVVNGSPSALSTRVDGGAFALRRQRTGGTKRRGANVVVATRVVMSHVQASEKARCDTRHDTKNTIFDTLGGRWVVATLKRRQSFREDGDAMRRLLHLGYCLNRTDLLNVHKMQIDGTVKDGAFALAMEQHVFGLADGAVDDDSSVVRESEQTLVVKKFNSSVSQKTRRGSTAHDAIIAIERAIVLARAIARTAKFAPTRPIGTPEDARLAREMNKQKSQYGERLVRELRRKVSQLRGECVQPTFPSNKATKRHEQSPQQVVARPSMKRRAPSPMAHTNSSASKRARRKSREPLVLRLKEPKVVIPGIKRASAFGRDITNATSEKTKRVVQSVSKAAAGFVRRQMSVKREVLTMASSSFAFSRDRD
jgi:hypothetical protein